VCDLSRCDWLHNIIGSTRTTPLFFSSLLEYFSSSYHQLVQRYDARAIALTVAAKDMSAISIIWYACVACRVGGSFDTHFQYPGSSETRA
jgi:diacylglycerol kinase